MSALIQTTILFMAGDVSGDINTARLAALLHERHPEWKFHAIGGAHLGAEVAKTPGGKWIADARELSGIGIHASLAIIPRGAMLSWKLRKFLRGHNIDAVVMCDWGAFNCRHINLFKKHRIPILYYFPPGSWWKHGSRGLGIAGQVERIATPFQWSAERLKEAGGNAEWVGHPMLEKKQDDAKRAALRREFGITGFEELVALLPGSRSMEIDCLGPRLAAAAELLRKQRPHVKFLAAVPAHRVEALQRHLPAWIPIVADRAHEVLHASEAAIVKSGTITLETAVIGTPQVVVYDLPWIGRIEFVALWMWKKNFPFIAMPNILLDREAVKELLGFDCTPEKMAAEISALLDDSTRRNRMLADYREIREKLGAGLPKGATLRTAEILEEMTNIQ